MLVREINISQTFRKTFANPDRLECSRNKEMDKDMNENAFSYTYSASENQEVLNIRKKYMPQEETKLEELKRLDNLVQSAGVMEGLIVGIGGCLIFGVGTCFGLGVFGSVTWLAVIFGLIGTVGMILAYPLNRKCYNKMKDQHLPRILELTAELTGNL